MLKFKLSSENKKFGKFVPVAVSLEACQDFSDKVVISTNDFF